MFKPIASTHAEVEALATKLGAKLYHMGDYFWYVDLPEDSGKAFLHSGYDSIVLGQIGDDETEEYFWGTNLNMLKQGLYEA
jgi:hypothetical protein